MQTFDICLRNKSIENVICLRERLTEIDVIISQLAQYTFSNYLYLLCSLSELLLLKSISGETSMEIDARILSLEKIIYEYMNNDIYMDIETDFSSQKAISGNTEMVLFADTINIIKKYPISVESILEIFVDPLDYDVAYSFGTVNFDMVLTTNQFEFLKKGFEKFESEMWISIESQLSSRKIVELEDLNMMLYINPVELFYSVLVSGEAETILSVSPIEQCILEKILHDLDVITFLSTSIDVILHLDKYISTEDIFQIFAEITEVLIDIIYPYENEIVLSCEASAELKRHRFLSEMDGSTVSEFDDITLHELDFITIA